MVEQIINAIDTQDYSGAALLIDQLKQQEPDNIWLPFYAARLAEAQGNLTAADECYRNLLPQAINAKLIREIRQGIERISKLEEKQRQIALSQAMDESGGLETGMLVLEKIPKELKQEAAQKFAKIVGVDPYTARLQLPSRSWRLYRTGAIGKLRFYAEELKQAEIPCFTALIDDISAIPVYQALHIQSVTSEVTVIYEPNKGQRDLLTFKWSEVKQRVEGLLPLFEECVDVGLRGKLTRKTETLDYAKFCDLHLPENKLIIRLCDQNYHFQEGMSFSETQKLTDGRATVSDSWNHILQFIEQATLNIPVCSEFTPFGESAIGFQELLRLIDPHINLLRREDTPWDGAFQLYSGLAFVNLLARS
ncbi:MAG: tetratricopeptide repeat protein [Cyanobacteria bacterium P01_G01_bin.49]